MVNKEIIGVESEPEYYEIEKGAIRKFAAAIGDKNPVYFDEDSARKKGYPSLLAPLSFPTTFRGKVSDWFQQLDKSRLLHGEQEYQYERRFYAGEKIKLTEVVSDVFEKNGNNGLLTFIVRSRRGYDMDDYLIFEEKSTFIIRGGK